MCHCEKADVQDALCEVHECCDRIASVLNEFSDDAEQLGDAEMLERFRAARAAADRACELVRRLAVIIEAEQSSAKD